MRYTLFGESHGPAIGIVLQDVPSGIVLDMDFINADRFDVSGLNTGIFLF